MAQFQNSLHFNESQSEIAKGSIFVSQSYSLFFFQCGKVNDALDICVQLNQWDYAVQLSKIHHLRDIDSLLGKYAEQFAGN